MIGKGSCVRISGASWPGWASAAAVLGTVEDLHALADLPNVELQRLCLAMPASQGMSFYPPDLAEQTRDILIEGGVTEVATISYWNHGLRLDVWFLALKHTNGWFNLKGQQLTIDEGTETKQ